MELNLLKRSIYEELQRLEEDKGIIIWMSGLDVTRVVPKDARLSEKLRVEGNRLFAEDKQNPEHNHKIIRLYNESIANAPVQSEELAKTYGNKSALFRRMRRYSECISEADRALKVTKSIPLKIKLLCREAECHTALGSLENRRCLEKAKFVMSKSEMSQESEETKTMLQKLIVDTESIVEENKLDTPKEAKKYSQTSRLVADAQEKDVRQNSVKMEYSEKYGHHFVAARDLEPGEIIILEKPYRSYLRFARVYQYCYHCLNYLWTVVPCDHCNWRNYCSEKCKNESWNEYHDLECAVASRIKALVGPESSTGYYVLSIFLKTVKEAGGIDKLQADLEAINENGGQCINDVSSDGELFYRSIYTSSAELSNENLENKTDTATILLLALAKYTKIFQKTYDFCELKDLIGDNTAIFVGALLLRLNVMVSEKSLCINLTDPTDPKNPTNKMTSLVANKDDRFYSFTFNSSSLMTLYGCIPNVSVGLTREHLCVWHSLQPIKKGDKLISYHVSSVYNYTPKEERQSMFRDFYKCSCDCQACTEDWSMTDLKKGKEAVARQSDIEIIQKIRNEINYISDEQDSDSSKFSNPDMKRVARVKDLVARAWKHCQMPSPTVVRAVNLFVNVLGWFYGPSNSDWK